MVADTHGSQPASRAVGTLGYETPPKEVVKMATNTLILKRYRVEGNVAAGGFGQIYSVCDIETKKEYALKWQVSGDRRRLKLEITVLLQLRGKKQFPMIIANGVHDEKGFIIMQALGKNLADLRRDMSERRFSDGTVYRVADQMTRALRDLHEIGFLHRDVKPNNMCIGAIDKTRVYLIDYGLVRQYTTESGEVRKPRDVVGFRGTPRYVPLQVHIKEEQGPSGDIISFIYSLIEMSMGILPWSKYKEPKEIEKEKKETTLEKLVENMPKPFQELAKNIWALEYEDFPDYDYLLEQFDKCLGKGYDWNELYDWEFREAERMVYEKRKQNAGSVLSVDPPKVHITNHPTIPQQHTLFNHTDVTYAYRISTSSAHFQCKPHYGFIGPKGKVTLTITVDKSTSASRRGECTTENSPSEGFHIYYSISTTDQETKDPRDIVKSASRKAKINLPLLVQN